MLASILIELIFVQTVNADDWYINGDAVLSNVNLESYFGSDVLNQSGSSKKLTVGKMLNKQISIEGFYSATHVTPLYKIGQEYIDGLAADILDFVGQVVFLGWFDSGDFGGIYADVDFDMKQFGISARYSYRSSQNSTYFAKGGISHWSADTNVSLEGEPIYSKSDNGMGFHYGVGYKRHFGDSFGLILDYERHHLKDIDAYFIGLGLEYLF